MTTDPRFEFIDCLGRGGFGEVYRARMHTAPGVHQLVAIKVLNDRARDVPKAIQRLRDEAHLLSALHHRSIVQLLDLVEIRERLGLVTEYIEGADLYQVLREDQRLPPKVALEVIGEVAGALHAAWSAPAPQTTTPMRLVHRDIKPANLRLTPEGSVKLLDFGIARSPEIDRGARTTTGVVVGTVGYFSPERLTEDIPQPSDDVYALGCVLFEALTGERLYRDMKRSELFRLAFHPSVHGKFIAGRIEDAEAMDALPPSLRPLLCRMLASEAKDRPTAGELETACFQLAKQQVGLSVNAWAAQRDWPPLPLPDASDLDRHSLDTRPLQESAPPNLASTTPPHSTDTESPTRADTPRLASKRPKPRPRPTTPEPRTASTSWMWLPVVLLGIAGAAWWMISHKRPDVIVPLGPMSPAELAPTPMEVPAADTPSKAAPAGDTAEEVPRLPPNPDAEPPAAMPASLDGDQLLTYRGGLLELRDLDSPARKVRRLSRPPGSVTDLCIQGDVLALAMGPLIEVRTVSKDAVVDRMRPGATVERVLCLDNGHVAAVSRTRRKGSGGSTGELIWWDTKGRVKGRLLPPTGVVDAAAMGDRILVLDGGGGVRTWEGQGSPVAQTVTLPGDPLGVSPSLGGPAWVAAETAACSLEGTCVEVDAGRAMMVSGVGWVAVAGPDRITVLDATAGKVIRELAAAPTAIFARTDGSLVVIEPEGLRVLDPVADRELANRSW